MTNAIDPIWRCLSLLCFLSISGCTDYIPFGHDPPVASDFVQSDQYTRWELEVDYAQGFAPNQQALDFAESRLASLVDKPKGVEILADEGFQQSGRKWSVGDLLGVSSRYQDQQSSAGTLVTHILYVDGEFTQGETLGVAINHELVVIFAESLRNGCAKSAFCTNPARIEEVVLTHELGHIIGLVNRGIAMVEHHEHAEEPKHSNNRNSIMWPSVDTSSLFDLLAPLGGGIPDDFDANDRADVCAAGGRCSR